MVGAFLTCDGYLLYRHRYSWVDSLDLDKVDLGFESLDCGYPRDCFDHPLAGRVVEWWPRFKLRWTEAGKSTVVGKERRLTVGCAVVEDLVNVGTRGDAVPGIVMPRLDFGGGWADDLLNEALPYGINEGTGYRNAAEGVIEGNDGLDGGDITPEVQWRYLPPRIASWKASAFVETEWGPFDTAGDFGDGQGLAAGSPDLLGRELSRLLNSMLLRDVYRMRGNSREFSVSLRLHPL